jgi:predicted ATPase/class 3 adenylate cyclase
MESTSSFGYWIRRQRKALDLTQQALAERVGCSPAAIRKIESDERRPSRQIAERMADILGVPANRREIFLEVARGLRPVDQLSLTGERAISTEIRSLPSGTVTFLYTDIEGSTKLAQEHPHKWESLRARHHAILQGAMDAHNGYIFQIIGDAFCVAFPTAGDALRAAVKSQVDLRAEDWRETPIRVRIGIHTGKAEVQEDGQYQGYVTLSHVQRLMSAGHGGQVLLSFASQELVQDELSEGLELRDMGEHRLKDFNRPEHLFQLNITGLPADFPPLNTLNSYRHNLPSQITSFIGREKEIEEVKHDLKDHRLVTLTGSGGTGKTRLALQVAADLLSSFPDGVWFVELAPLTNPGLIPQTIHTTLGLFEQQGKSFLQMLLDFLREKTVLLLIDNCEHLIEACAQLTDTLLRHSTALKILATSREALGVKGELAWRVPSLSLPDPKKMTEFDGLTQYEAIRLFIDRAALANPHFTMTKDNAPVITQTCHRLDGIPLALELAAARLKALSVEQIAARLDDRFRLLTGGARTALPRQQTLRALIDWSYNLLSEKEKTLFRRLTVFVGGWTLEAAEAVCSDESIASFETLDSLSSLVDKSLITMQEVAGEARYRRLETIRQYAREKFFDTDEVTAVRNRHLVWMLDWAEKMEEELEGIHQVLGLRQIKSELENVRSAIEWGSGTDQIEKSMRIVSALFAFWDGSHPYQESRQWLEKGLDARENLTKRTLVRTLSDVIWLAYRQNDLAVVNRYAEENLALARELNDKSITARALRTMSMACSLNGRFSESEQYNEEARIIYQELGSKDELVTLISDKIVGLMFEDIPRAVRLAEEHASLFAEVSGERWQAYLNLILAWLEVSQGELERSITLTKKSLLLYRQLNNHYRIGSCLLGFANIANIRNDLIRAARLLGARNAIYESIGAVGDPETQRFFITVADQTKSRLDEETFQFAWEEGKSMTVEQAIEYALNVAAE